MRSRGAVGWTAVGLGGIVAAAFVVLPLTGRVPVVRVAPILLFFFLVVIVAARPWRWSSEDWTAIDAWQPSSRVIRLGAAITGFVLCWFVVTRFRSGEINAIDFTVYYDRPNFQTAIGNVLFIESGDDPTRSWRTYLAVHAHWAMVPLALFYLVWPSPLWTLTLSVFAVIAGAVYSLRIIQRTGGGGALAVASAFAFVLNDNTARTLNYGFHAEVLYAWFVPWMIDAALRRRWMSFLLAGLATASVKEDAFLPLLAVVATVFLVPGKGLTSVDRLLIVPAPLVLALINLGLFLQVVVPRFSATGVVFYASYWANYGPTTGAAMLEMLQHPWRVLTSTLTSSFLTAVALPHLYLPFVGWRWFVGALPIVILYGASANEQLRSFGIYYAIVLVPFLVLAAAAGARRLAELVDGGARARVVLSAVVIIGAMAGGVSSGGYSLRPWKQEIAKLPQVLESLSAEKFVLVQSGLYPHAGYDSRVQLLTSHTLADPRFAGAAIVLAPALSAYPFDREGLAPLLLLPEVLRTREGLLVVRQPGGRYP
jgi:uncharacterized membrane protein